MEYKTLANLFHMDTSDQRHVNVEERAQQRREAEATFRTGITVAEGELFLAVPRELSILAEKVLRIDRKVSTLFKSLAPIVRFSIIRSLIADEVVWSHNLEGIHSTRKHVAELLHAPTIDTLNDKRLLEAAHIYLALADGTPDIPRTPSDIRAIYDKTINLEEDDTSPDGRLFRTSTVEVVDGNGRVRHRGVTGEDAIYRYMQQMIDLNATEEIPALYSAIMSHYIFEYVHPFYDGNGRLGRYLLSLYLSEPLSMVTALSLSRVIAENKEQYYKAFAIAEDPLNHGELTFFVITMLENIRTSQSQLVESIEAQQKRMELIEGKINECVHHFHLDKYAQTTIFQFMQEEVFGLGVGLGMKDIQEYVGLSQPVTRRILQELEDAKLVTMVRKRPLHFTISSVLRDYFA